MTKANLLRNACQAMRFDAFDRADGRAVVQQTLGPDPRSTGPFTGHNLRFLPTVFSA